MIIVVVNVLYMVDFIYIKVCVYGNMERIWFYIWEFFIKGVKYLRI